MTRPEVKFVVIYANVFNLSSFDLSHCLGLPTSIIQSHSPLCIATQITDCYWSDESFHSLISLEIRVHLIGTEKKAQVRPTCSIFEQYRNHEQTLRSTPVKLSLLRRISLKIRPQSSLFFPFHPNSAVQFSSLMKIYNFNFSSHLKCSTFFFTWKSFPTDRAEC